MADRRGGPGSARPARRLRKGRRRFRPADARPGSAHRHRPGRGRDRAGGSSASATPASPLTAHDWRHERRPPPVPPPAPSSTAGRRVDPADPQRFEGVSQRSTRGVGPGPAGGKAAAVAMPADELRSSSPTDSVHGRSTPLNQQRSSSRHRMAHVVAHRLLHQHRRDRRTSPLGAAELRRPTAPPGQAVSYTSDVHSPKAAAPHRPVACSHNTSARPSGDIQHTTTPTSVRSPCCCNGAHLYQIPVAQRLEAMVDCVAGPPSRPAPSACRPAATHRPPRYVPTMAPRTPSPNSCYNAAFLSRCPPRCAQPRE